MRRLPFVIAIILLSFFASAVPAGQPTAPPDANKMLPDHAPTPYSAAEIREACPAGRVIKFRIEEPGKPVMFSVLTFGQGDKENAMYEAGGLDENGKPLGEKKKASTPWKELQSHASFPAADTTIERAEKQVGATTYDCWHYVVKSEDGKEVTDYWFAVKLPGPPILLETRVNGKAVRTMTQVLP